MNRITIYEQHGKVLAVRETLAKHPPGNAAQRAKSLKSGWRPEWRRAEHPRAFTPDMLEPFQVESEEL